MNDRYPTEQALQNWRYGQPQAERLSADILIMEGFKDIDPQAPLGGPDGLKDIVCHKNGRKLIAAVYFPATLKTYADVENKFLHDLKGVVKNSASGIIFLTNQRLTLGERKSLSEHAKRLVVEIYHVERIRMLLDTPKGFFLRLEYLRIPMTQEDQVGLLDEFKVKFSDHFMRQEKSIETLQQKMDILMVRTMTMSTNLATLPSSLKSSLELDARLAKQYPTSALTAEQLLWLHRALLSNDDANTPLGTAGFRSVTVWVGGSSPDSATFTPMPPTMIPASLGALLARWKKGYSTLLSADPQSIMIALAEFHYDFLKIHPFIDGNGRVARAILQQQAKELLNKDINAVFSDDPASYYDALKVANTGDLSALTALIRVILE